MRAAKFQLLWIIMAHILCVQDVLLYCYILTICNIDHWGSAAAGGGSSSWPCWILAGCIAPPTGWECFSSLKVNKIINIGLTTEHVWIIPRHLHTSEAYLLSCHTLHTMLHSVAVVSQPGMFEDGLDLFKKEEARKSLLIYSCSCSLCLCRLAVVSELLPGWFLVLFHGSSSHYHTSTLN